MGEPAPHRIYEFGDFRLDARLRQLLRRGEAQPLPITARVFDTLIYLVEHRDRLIEKSELLSAVWPDVVVEENSLTTNISTLRRLLGERPEEHRYIVTISGRGYQFVANVTANDASAAERVAATAANNARLTPLAAVAVLPFENQTGDPSLDRPGGILVQSLNLVLSEAHQLSVVAQRSADAYAAAGGDVRAIARALGATHLVEIGASQGGDELKVRARLIDGGVGYQVWSREFRTTRAAILQGSDDIVLAIAAVIEFSVGGVAFEDHDPGTRDIEAYIEFVRGARSHRRTTEGGYVAAIAHYEAATRRDPDFSQAWQLLAVTHNDMMSFGFERPDSVARFREAASHARNCCPDSRFAHAACATIAVASGQWDEAETHYDADGADVAYMVYIHTGRLRDAERKLRRVHETSGSWPAVGLNLALLRDFAGDHRESQSFADDAVRSGMSEDTKPMHALKANAAEAAGRHSDAANHMMKLLPPSLRAQGGDEAVHLYYEALGKPGARARALAALGRLERALDHDQFNSYLLRLLLITWYTRLEALDDAYRLADDWLAQYRSSGLVGWPYLSTLWSHQLREFRRDARFAGFVAGLNLMDYWKKRGPPDHCRLDGDKLQCD